MSLASLARQRAILVRIEQLYEASHTFKGTGAEWRASAAGRELSALLAERDAQGKETHERGIRSHLLVLNSRIDALLKGRS